MAAQRRYIQRQLVEFLHRPATSKINIRSATAISQSAEPVTGVGRITSRAAHTSIACVVQILDSESSLTLIRYQNGRAERTKNARGAGDSCTAAIFESIGKNFWTYKVVVQSRQRQLLGRRLYSLRRHPFRHRRVLLGTIQAAALHPLLDKSEASRGYVDEFVYSFRTKKATSRVFFRRQLQTQQRPPI